LARLGRAGVIGYASGFFEPTASHLPASSFPRNEGLLGQTPRPQAKPQAYDSILPPQARQIRSFPKGYVEDFQQGENNAG
jgi:hypothetical protein